MGDFLKNNKLIILVVILVLLGGGGTAYYFYSQDQLLAKEAEEGTFGVAFDWQKGEVLNNYEVVSFMPDGWSFVSFDSKSSEGITYATEFWAPMATPQIGSRTVKISDIGDDVKTLQTGLNMLRTDDKTDEYFFEPLIVNGIFDETTVNAVKILQRFFDQNQSGEADINFQASVYGQITSPATENN